MDNRDGTEYSCAVFIEMPSAAELVKTKQIFSNFSSGGHFVQRYAQVGMVLFTPVKFH
jgi:hypothetical protein